MVSTRRSGEAGTCTGHLLLKDMEGQKDMGAPEVWLGGSRTPGRSAQLKCALVTSSWPTPSSAAATPSLVALLESVCALSIASVGGRNARTAKWWRWAAAAMSRTWVANSPYFNQVWYAITVTKNVR